jgi:hypothetical protein
MVNVRQMTEAARFRAERIMLLSTSHGGAAR